MEFLHSDAGFNLDHFVSWFGSTTGEQCTFVDVGGSHGHVSIALARRCPNLNCIVQDLPASVKIGEA